MFTPGLRPRRPQIGSRWSERVTDGRKNKHTRTKGGRGGFAAPLLNPSIVWRLERDPGMILGSVAGNLCVWFERKRSQRERGFMNRGSFSQQNLWRFCGSYSCQVPTKLAASFFILWPLCPELWPIKPAKTLIFAEPLQHSWFFLWYLRFVEQNSNIQTL